MTIATSRNMTIFGALVIFEALLSAAVLLMDGNPATNPDLNAMKMQIMVGITAIMGKGASSTGGTVDAKGSPVTNIAAGLALFIGLGLLTPAFAQVDPTAEAGNDPATVIASEFVEATPDPRWSFKLAGFTISPSASFSPTVLSLNDLFTGNFSTSTGPNVGAGLDLVRSNGYGAALHATLRDTTIGTRPLASLYGIFPFLQKYKVRPGVSYQIGGEVPSWKNAFILGFAISDNFGYAPR